MSLTLNVCFGEALFNEAAASKASAIAETVEEIRKEAEKRRTAGKKKPGRPERYLYMGVPEEWHTEYPSNVNLDEYDIIGKDVERILHRTPARVWVECIERPILRRKGQKDLPSPVILQGKGRRIFLRLSYCRLRLRLLYLVEVM